MVSTHPTHVFDKMQEIENFITGFARIIMYEVHSFNIKVQKYDPLFQTHMNKLVALEEGKFENSHLNGFGRIIDYRS